MKGREIIETPTNDKMRRIIKLVDKIKEEEGLEGLKFVFYESEDIEIDSKYNILKRRLELHISDKFLEYFEFELIRSMIYHEVYHLKNDVKSLSILNLLADLTLFGRGGVTAIIDMPGREYQADRYAAEKTSLSDIKKAIERRKEARFDIAFELYNQGVQEDEDKITKFISNLYNTFTKADLRGYIHPTVEERLDHLDSL